MILTHLIQSQKKQEIKNVNRQFKKPFSFQAFDPEWFRNLKNTQQGGQKAEDTEQQNKSN